MPEKCKAFHSGLVTIVIDVQLGLEFFTPFPYLDNLLQSANI